ncbi:MAG: hypothetical protein KatS3mg115_0045 [Candidatus Poribacteria bacterium]|nr:MAG: hypothetical protein KatS3mg115_0045 [Candidatus Poribacteria bacterium]
MPIKILRRSSYQRLLAALDERNALREERDRLSQRLRETEESRRSLEAKLRELREQMEEQESRLEELIQQRAEELIAEMHISRRRFEQLAADRADLIELYTERLYAMAQRFALQSVEEQQNRGLLILLVDRRNMNPQNFSDFHDGQLEYLEHEEFLGIERIPHIFSPKAQAVLDWMGGKELRLSRDGEIVGYEERDGAILVDLRGVIFKTRQMIEGVRTHKVYSKVERLLDGGARHNAALYASSLEEVLVAIAVSEENNRVTIFRDGRFVEAFDPYEKRRISREEYFSQMRREESHPTPLDAKS